ncbi:MAG: D-alanyl-D-alanine carboxypeptidase [Oscillospiraceae bacterium]|nr:D-alanyl-D-alanine carboxypeptidase [Oscillospiraceae bacterium]
MKRKYRVLSFAAGFLMFLLHLPRNMQRAYAVPDRPELSAKACALMDAETGQLVLGMNAQEKRPMASTTKIMTTLLTLESGDLDKPFTVDSEAIHVEGSSMGLQEGDTVTKRALCAGMLLPSGNDAANAAAVAVAGSIPDFLNLMNERAKKIGMTRSYFSTPSGLDAEGHGASAEDMALLAREALKNPDFAAICRKPSMTVTFGNPPCARTLTNTNKLLKMDSTVIGVKTGFTDAAGRCLVSACTRGGRTLICVTLFDRDDWNDHKKLYDYGFSLAEDCTLPLPDSLSIAAEGGSETAIPVYAREPLTLTAWRGIPPEITVSVLLPPFLTAPVAKGTPVGELVYSGEHGEVARLPLYTAKELTAVKNEPKPRRSFFAWLKEIFRTG